MTQMSSGRMKLAEHARSVHVVSVPVGVTLEQAMAPDFWAHVAHQIKPKDRLEMWAEDRSWFADAIVVKASRLEVHIRTVHYLNLDGAAAEPAPVRKNGYHVDYGGPVDLHRVVRDGDAKVMTLGLTKPEAEQWIADQVGVETGRLTLAPVAAVVEAEVVIPDDWRSLSWQDRRSLASKLTDDPIHNGEEANAAIEAALAARASVAA